MEYRVEFDQEVDDRWKAVTPELPGVIAYGNTLDEAVARLKNIVEGVVNTALTIKLGIEDIEQ